MGGYAGFRFSGCLLSQLPSCNSQTNKVSWKQSKCIKKLWNVNIWVMENFRSRLWFCDIKVIGKSLLLCSSCWHLFPRAMMAINVLVVSNLKRALVPLDLNVTCRYQSPERFHFVQFTNGLCVYWLKSQIWKHKPSYNKKFGAAWLAH